MTAGERIVITRCNISAEGGVGRYVTAVSVKEKLVGKMPISEFRCDRQGTIVLQSFKGGSEEGV